MAAAERRRVVRWMAPITSTTTTARDTTRQADSKGGVARPRRYRACAFRGIAQRGKGLADAFERERIATRRGFDFGAGFLLRKHLGWNRRIFRCTRWMDGWMDGWMTTNTSLDVCRRIRFGLCQARDFSDEVSDEVSPLASIRFVFPAGGEDLVASDTLASGNTSPDRSKQLPRMTMLLDAYRFFGGRTR